MGWPKVLLLVAAVAGQAAQLPPPFPRPGTTALLENDVVAVWNVSWLKQQYPLHTHLYDLVGVSYAEGDRIITQGSGPGRLVNTKAWVFQTNRANVTHVEEGASDPPMRAVLIEVKPPRPARTGRGADRWPAPGGRSAGLGEQPRRRLGRDARGASPHASPRRRRRRTHLRWIDDAEGGVRDGRDGSRGPHAGGRRAGVHLRAQVVRRRHEAERWSPHVPGHLCDGGRRRHAPPRRVWTSRRERPAGVQPIGAAHHRCEVRVRARKPVREDPHQPGHLGMRRSRGRHSGHVPDGPELRPAAPQPEPAQRASACSSRFGRAACSAAPSPASTSRSCRPWKRRCGIWPARP